MSVEIGSMLTAAAGTAVLGTSAALTVLIMLERLKRRRYVTVRGLKDSFLFKYFLRQMYPRQGSRVWSLTEGLIRDSLLDMKVEILYNIKYLAMLLMAVLYILISATNVAYRTGDF